MLLPDLLDVVAVENLERESEPSFKFVFPLQQHGRRAGNDNFAHAPSQ
jgi:hypothetical protein